MKARFATRRAERLPPVVKASVVLEKPKKKRAPREKAPSTKSIVRMLNLAAVGGAFDAPLEEYREVARSNSKGTKARKAGAVAYFQTVEAIAEGLVGRALPDVTRKFSRTNQRPFFRVKK